MRSREFLPKGRIIEAEASRKTPWRVVRSKNGREQEPWENGAKCRLDAQALAGVVKETQLSVFTPVPLREPRQF